MRFIYSVLITLVAIFLPFKLLTRSIKEPLYRKYISERYGLVAQVEEGRIWIHCISVGESIAAKPLCQSLLKTHKLIITCTTASGREQLNRMYQKQIKDNLILVSYIPVDVSIFNKIALTRWQPSQVIFVETDIWPNICRICQFKNIPLKLINARLSVKSFNGYKKLGHFFTQTINCFDVVAVQFDLDAEHFINLGLVKDKIKITGSIKADISIDPGEYNELLQHKKQLARPIWLAASTHAPEEKSILEIHKKLLSEYPNALLIIAPRHPNRFNEVSDLIKNWPYKFEKRSVSERISPEVSVYLVDSIGELLRWMVISDLVFMGKSLNAKGGHNPLEPAYLKKPIISGQNVNNFQNIYSSLESNKGAIIVKDSDELYENVRSLIDNKKRLDEMGDNAQQCYQYFSGALQKTIKLIH